MTVPQQENDAASPDGIERRKSSKDRRARREDRRNSDRVLQEDNPRRDPDARERRKSG